MKKVFAFVLAIIMVTTMFTGCGKTPETAYDPEKDAVVDVENGSVMGPKFADLVQIPGYDYLYYSTTSRTVHYLFTDTGTAGYSYGFFGPYIINGHYCEYVDGEIVEIILTVQIEDVTI